MEVVSYHKWSDFVYTDNWGFVVWHFKKTNWRYCIAELTFIFGVCNKASDNIWTFPRAEVPDTYIGKKNNNMVYLCTCFIMLPLHRNDGMESKRRLAYATDIADFYRMQNCGEKYFESGAKREGRWGFRKQDIFWGGHYLTTNSMHFNTEKN